MAAEPLALTIGVTTRNRPESLARCLASLVALGDLVTEIIVIDDTSDLPVREALATLVPAIRRKITFITQPDRQGYIVARNAIMRSAATRYVLLLDDDTYVLDPAPLREILGMLEAHPDVGAVGCAQANADGSPWPASMQPSPVSYPCCVPSFIGFAHVLRRGVFLMLGGYRESFQFYGEEKDYCLRLLNAGYRVVYVPSALVAHIPDTVGRSQSKYVRYAIRNDCLSGLYNEPLPMVVLTLPMPLARYSAMPRNSDEEDPGGFRWLVTSLVTALPEIWRNRTPVTWASIWRWRSLRRAPEAFDAAPAV